MIKLVKKMASKTLPHDKLQITNLELNSLQLLQENMNCYFLLFGLDITSLTPQRKYFHKIYGLLAVTEW